MINIKRFVDKVTTMENKRKDIVLSLDEARGLKDEITQLLADLHQLNSRDFVVNSGVDENIKVEVNGGRW